MQVSLKFNINIDNVVYYNIQLEKPTLRGPDDVIVKVAFAGICGTDLHILSVSETRIMYKIIRVNEFAPPFYAPIKGNNILFNIKV